MWLKLYFTYNEYFHSFKKFYLLLLSYNNYTERETMCFWLQKVDMIIIYDDNCHRFNIVRVLIEHTHIDIFTCLIVITCWLIILTLFLIDWLWLQWWGRVRGDRLRGDDVGLVELLYPVRLLWFVDVRTAVRQIHELLIHLLVFYLKDKKRKKHVLFSTIMWCLIAVHARLFICGGNVALHGLITQCTLINFRKCSLHVFYLDHFL